MKSAYLTHSSQLLNAVIAAVFTVLRVTEPGDSLSLSGTRFSSSRAARTTCHASRARAQLMLLRVRVPDQMGGLRDRHPLLFLASFPKTHFHCCFAKTEDD